jgi:hypothetical protein
MWLIFRYHLGSLAFGSFIVALVKFIRAILKWIQSRLSGATAGPLKIMLGALDCVFKFLERFLKFLSDRAYIMVNFGICTSFSQK